MPKAKPDQVVGIRLELQESERTALEAALYGRMATNAVSAVGSVLTGIGTALSPFRGAIEAFAVAWIAEKGIGAALDAAKSLGESMKDDIEESLEGEGAKFISYYSAWLQGKFGDGGWEAVCAGRQELMSDYYSFNPVRALMGPQWFFDEFLRFFDTVCDPNNVMAKSQSPVDLWASWYSVEQYGKDAYYHAQRELSQISPLTKFVGWA